MDDSLAIAIAYYTAMNNKDAAGMSEHLHEDVRFLGPLWEMHGKEKVLEAAEGSFKMLADLAIREKFGAGNKAMVVMNMNLSVMDEPLRAASLLTFDGKLIKEIELFYDARPFEQ